MKKKIAAGALCAALLLACCAGCTMGQNDDNQAGSFTFTEENYPSMGGSLAALPLGEAITATVLGIDREAANGKITFAGSTTDNYAAILNGTFDIVLVYEPSQEAREMIEASDVKLEMTPIGVDALVFICGIDNPVEELTTEEIKAIYSGRITNWSEVGGNDLEIIPYQRNKTSGSQTLFDKLINLGDELMEPPSEYVVDSMIGLLQAVSNYETRDEALGYTVYYYLTNMEAETLESSKLLAVDGVVPSNETIASGEYTLSNDFYVAIRADEAEDSPARVLYNWICSDQGRELAAAENYVVK